MKNLQNIKIERIGYGWVWIAKLEDGKKLLIKWWALPWSIVDVNITKKYSDYLEWHIAKIHEYDKSFLDNEIFCPHFFTPIINTKSPLNPLFENEGTLANNTPSLSPCPALARKRGQGGDSNKIGCGWCKWQMISYNKQLELKEWIVQDCFRKLENKPTFLPIIWSPKEKWYRNKIEFSFWVYISAKEWRDEKRNLWFHKQWEFSKIIDIDSCWLISQKMNQVFEYLKKLCFESWLPTFDQKFHRWFFRHLVIREWQNTNQLLINLNVFPLLDDDTDWKQKRENLKNQLKADEFVQKNISTFVVTYNSGLADIVKGQDITTETLRWDGYIYEEFNFPKEWENGIVSSKFRISPFSFFQTNTHGAEKLFGTAAQSVWEIKWKILDLYCGAGSIWISFLKLWIWSELLWIEIVPEAIQDARYNAEINWVKDKCQFIASAAEKILLPDCPPLWNGVSALCPALAGKPRGIFSNFSLTDIWLVIVDPPREWLHSNVINRIANLKKSNNFKLLYISCNPTTMARDIELFDQLWFKVKSLQPVDMFPHTHHIETIWILI